MDPVEDQLRAPDESVGSRAGRRLSRVGLEADVDPVRWAGLLRRAHTITINGGDAPAVTRAIVASSWRRATAAGVDPDGYAPTILDQKATGKALAQSPLSPHLPLIHRMLSEAIDAGGLAVLADPEGLLLWVEGPAEALEVASFSGFLPGHLCSESAVGTNAVGTALVLGDSVQIFSAEHFNRRFHGLTCSAAPIRDPGSGRTVAVLNLSGDFRSGHPYSLPLVRAVANVLEHRLGDASREVEEQLRSRYLEWVAGDHQSHSALVAASGRILAASPKGWLGPRLRRRQGELLLPAGVEVDGHVIDPEGGAVILRSGGGGDPARPPHALVVALRGRRVLVSIGDWRTLLSARQSQILAALVLHPEGLGCEELGALVYGKDFKSVTVRAEVSRLRRTVGPLLAADPYRLAAPVRGEREALVAVLDAVGSAGDLSSQRDATPPRGRLQARPDLASVDQPSEEENWQLRSPSSQRNR